MHSKESGGRLQRQIVPQQHRQSGTDDTSLLTQRPEKLCAYRVLVACVVILACASILACMFDSPSAQAKVFHRYESQITEVPSGSSCQPTTGQLLEVNSMATSEGMLYVAESLDGYPVNGIDSRVDEFDAATGHCVAQLSQPPDLVGLEHGVGIGGPASEEKVFVGAESATSHPPVGVIAMFSLGACGTLACATLQEEWTGADAPGGAFGAKLDVAVDDSQNPSDWASGDVFAAVNRTGVNAVDVFRPEAGGGEHYVTQITGTGPGESFAGETEHVAVSGFNGDVVIQAGRAVDVFEPTTLGTYAFLGSLAPPSGGFEDVQNVAVDGGGDGRQEDGDIYVATYSAIYEFGPELRYLGEVSGRQTPEQRWAFGAETPQSLAVEPASHRLFVGVRRSEPTQQAAIDAFSANVTVPDTITEPVSNLKLLDEGEAGGEHWSLKLNGEVDPDEAGAASCQFIWGTSKAFGHIAPCATGVANGDSFARVHANLDKLEPDTTYYYRLQATNANGTDAGEEVQDREFTTPGPGLLEESATHVSSTSAELRATIAPHDTPMSGREQDLQEPASSPTTAYFQYSALSTADCETDPTVCTSIPLPPESLGIGEERTFDQRLQGLRADTTYHYRVVAANEALPGVHPGSYDAFYGPDQTFTTQGPGGSVILPDGRAWEMVSPPDKHGAVILPIREAGVTQASAAGDTFTFLTNIPTETEPQGVSGAVQVLAERGPGGWSSTDVSVPRDTPQGLFTGVGSEYRFFSEDLAFSLTESLGSFSPPVAAGTDEAFPEATERTPYLRHDLSCPSEPDTCYTPLLTAASGYADVAGVSFGGNPVNAQGAAVFVGATTDAQHAVISSSVQLTSAPAPGGGLYEWSADAPATGRLELVSQLPPAEGGGAAEFPVLGREGVARHAISRNGSRVVFSAGGHLYMRDLNSGETIRLDQSEAGVTPNGSDRAHFQTANTEGTEVFFTDSQALTESAGVSGEDLYVCDIPGVANGAGLHCELHDLTPEPRGVPGGEHEPAEIQGALPGASESGDYVYFVANGALAPGATGGDCENIASPTERTCNLYVAHQVAGVWQTTFIAALSSDDTPDWTAVPNALSRMTSRVSPNGQWLAFMSDRKLTGYDNRDARSGEADEEVYLYDAAEATLVCASCDPTGARPVGVAYKQLDGKLAGGDGVWPVERWLAANLPGWTPYSVSQALYQSRYLSNSGRLFFNSNDALVPQDENGNEDVYEYEPAGVGNCDASAATFSARSLGCVGLISSGAGSGESAFLDASEDGSDIFFLTGERLVPRDVDNARDVYDAHECTAASPCSDQSLEEPSECDSASECRAAPAPQPPIYGAPASATFSGPGNPPTAPTQAQPGVKQKLKKKSLKKKKKKKKKRRSRQTRRGSKDSRQSKRGRR